jgi:hypothetical protein
MNPNIIPIKANAENSDHQIAEVRSLSMDRVIIDCHGSVVSARKAYSCLIVPRVGDRVMVNSVEGDYFILAILERPGHQDMTLEFPSSVQMDVKAGGIGIAASENIDVLTSSSCNLMANDLNFSSLSMKLQTGTLTSQTQKIEAHTRDIHLFAEMLNTVAERVTQRAGMVVRWVETMETLNIGNLIQKIRHNYTTHADQAVITAKSDMRIDAERIHMG